MIEIKPAHQKDAEPIASIAAPIWRQHYTQIIGAEQVEYMLNKFQSEAAITAQMEQGYDYFVVYVNSEAAGYMALHQNDQSLFISKFYLAQQFRGQGLAKQMMAEIIQQANMRNLKQLELTVNKFNPAYQIYLKLGFSTIDSIQIDIGEGYIMDDYRMLKRL